MAVIKIYLSEDGENYVSKFPNSTKEFSSICEKGHYQIPLGWSFGGTHKTNTFQCRLSGTPYYINEFEKYKHIKVTKDGNVVFLGSNPTFKKTIEKADYYEVTATYEDYSRMFSDVLFSSDPTWEKMVLTSDGWTVCNPSDTSHSLVHYLFSRLNTDNTFTLHCTHTDSTPVSYVYFKYNNRVLDAWDKCLKQNSLAYYVVNRDVYVFDVLEQISGTATTIPNIESEATINEKPYIDHTLPAIRRPKLIQNYPSGGETRVYDSGTITVNDGSLIGGGTRYDGTMQAGAVKVGDNQEVKAMRNLRWHFSGSHSNNPKFKVQTGASYETTTIFGIKTVVTPYSDSYTGSASGSAYDETLKFILVNDNIAFDRSATVWMTANIDVLDYNALTKPFNETEWNGKEEKCEYIFESTNADAPEQNALRYLNALRYASKMEAKKYNFYSDLDLALNTVCVIQNVTTADEIANHEYIRITDKVDNLDDFGGYTYTGVPYVSEQVVADSFFNPVVFDEKSISKAFDFYANRTNVLITKNGEIAPNQTITYTISLREYYAVPTLMVDGVAQALVRRTVTDTSVSPNVVEYLNIWDCTFNPATLTTVNGNIRAVANLDGEIRQIDIGIIVASVQDVAVQYRLSDSKDEVTGDYQWSETKPTGSGYIWRRQKYTYSDGSVLYSEPVYLLVSSDVVLTEYRLENLGSNVISHNAERTGQQTLAMRAVIVGVTSPLPVIESVSIPRLWAYSSGGNRETVIPSLYAMMNNETPFTPAFSGANDWVRTDTEVYTSATGSIAVGYEFSDGSYATAILAISNIGQTDITGTITSIYEYSLIGIDDRNPEVQAIAYVPYKTNAGASISFSLFDVSAGSKVEKGIVTFSIIEETRSPKSFGTSESIISRTYYTTDGEVFYYINGDSYVYLTFSTDVTSGEVTKEAQIYTFQNGVWTSVSSLTDSTEIHRIHLQSIEDIFAIYSGENHVSVNGYDWFKQIIAEHISSTYYFVGGAIYGKGLNGNIDMTQPKGNRATGDAFIIDSNGVMEMSSGYARNLNVRGVLNLYDATGTNAGAEIMHPALTTVGASEGDPVGVSADPAVAWQVSDLTSLISLSDHEYSVSGSYGSDSVSKLMYLTDASQYGASSIGSYHNGSQNAYIRNAVYGNNIFVGLDWAGTSSPSAYGSYTYSRILTSTDGTSWVERQRGSEWYAMAMTFSNGYFYAYFYNRGIYRSTDGNSWNYISNPSISGVNGIAVRGGMCIITSSASDGGIFKSTDFSSFSAVSSGAFKLLSYCEPEDAFYCVQGLNLYKSENGTTFDIVGTVPDVSQVSGSSSLFFLRKTHAVFFAFGYYTPIYYSLDGNTWTTFRSTDSFYGGCVAGNVLHLYYGYYGRYTQTAVHSTIDFLYDTYNLSTSNNNSYLRLSNSTWITLNPSEKTSVVVTLSGDISFNSASHLVCSALTNFVNYTSYTTAGGTTKQIEIGKTYRITGSSFQVNGVNKTPNYFQRNSSTSVSILLASGEILQVVSGSFYYVSGTIKIAGTLGGVEMMGQYPKTDMVYDVGTPEKRWLTGYISSLPLTSKRSEKKDIAPYERSAIETLKNVEIVRFKFKKDPRETPLIGFIADDTDSDLSGENHDSMMVNNCLAVLIKAVQELSAEVNRIKELL